MMIAMAAFAVLISAMFVASIIASVTEAAREARDGLKAPRYRIF